MKKTDPKTFPFKCIIWTFVELLAAFLTLVENFQLTTTPFYYCKIKCTWDYMACNGVLTPFQTFLTPLS